MGRWVSTNVLEKGNMVDSQRRCVKASVPLICYVTFLMCITRTNLRNGLGQYHIMFNAYVKCLK